MEVPQEIREAFAQRVGLTHPDAPIFHSWVFDPRDATVHVSDDHDKPRRHKDHHDGLAEKAGHHPARQHGYAYRIRGGWRITDTSHKAVDQFVARTVVKTLNEHEGEQGLQTLEAVEVERVQPSAALASRLRSARPEETVDGEKVDAADPVASYAKSGSTARKRPLRRSAK